MRQLVKGMVDMQALKIVHRDMKLANVLLHFPNCQDFNQQPARMKRKFLQTVDLTE